MYYGHHWIYALCVCLQASAAAIMGVGVWMIVDKNISSYFEVLTLDTEDPYFK